MNSGSKSYGTSGGMKTPLSSGTSGGNYKWTDRQTEF